MELNSKGLYQSSVKEKENCCLVFLSSTKRGIRHFRVVVVQRTAEKCTKIKKRVHVQSCCFANINLLRARCRRRRLHKETTISRNLLINLTKFGIILVNITLQSLKT